MGKPSQQVAHLKGVPSISAEVPIRISAEVPISAEVH